MYPVKMMLKPMALWSLMYMYVNLLGLFWTFVLTYNMEFFGCKNIFEVLMINILLFFDFYVAESMIFSQTRA